VGALRETMKRREVPMVVTSAKSNFGHTEAAAGICGIARCMVMLRAMSGACNLHLRNINPHIEYAGYPALFVSEAVDCGRKTGISGVSSFGVGGTNARGDLWARSVYGYLSSDTVLPTRKVALSSAIHHRIKDNGKPGPGPADELLLVGSWNGWSDMTEMEDVGEGEWVATLTPGDVQRERFRIVLNRIPHLAFYPSLDGGGSDAEVLGPDWESRGNAWVIDARADRAPPNSVYRIRFSWGFSFESGEYRRIAWERLDAPPEDGPLVDGGACKHSYWIAATWTGWLPSRMAAVGGGASTYETTARIGARGVEEFQFLRDQDWKQVIYPAAAKAVKPSVPVRGPDDGGGDKAWAIRGDPGDVYTVQLAITDRAICVRARSSTACVNKTWTTAEDEHEGWHDYWVVGTFADHFIPMAPYQGGAKSFRCRVQLDETGTEDFQISVDHDLAMMLYPTVGGASFADSMVCGPDNYGSGLSWTITGAPGSTFEVLLGRLMDSTYVVSWAEVEGDGQATLGLSNAEAAGAQDPPLAEALEAAVGTPP